MAVKMCLKCGQEKELSCFHKRSGVRSGVQPRCKDCCKSINAERYLQKKNHILSLNAIWRTENADYKRDIGRRHYHKNKEKFSQYQKDNRQLINRRKRERKKSDPLFKLNITLRNRIRKFFKESGYDKGRSGIKLVGAPLPTVKNHIELLFKDGMSWSNHGDWHIDHIIPLSSAKSKEELIKLCHYTNLQPLWAKENLSKYNKILEHGSIS
jgi:hypothetical protein